VIVLDRTAVSMTAQAALSATSNVAVTGAGGSVGGLAVTVAGATPGAPLPAWLSATLSSASAPATLQLSADASHLAPNTYAALVTVSSSSTPGVVSQTVNVTLVVSEPSPTAVLKDLMATLTPGGTSALSAEIRQYLDQHGNNNGQFDVGDILAYFDRTGAVLDRATLDAVRSAAARQPASKPPVDSPKVRRP
jgi:hypothetical protein